MTHGSAAPTPRRSRPEPGHLTRRAALLLLLASAALVALATPAGAHAFGGRKDLPLPAWLFFYGGAAAVIVSFTALGLLWPTSRLERPIVGWVLPRPVQAAAPALAVAIRAVGLALLVGVFLTAAVGENSADFNAAPRAVYVVFWVGMTVVSALVGNLWRLLSPFETIYAIARWARGGTDGAGDEDETGEGRGGLPDVGYWPAAVLLFGFVFMELRVYDRATEPRVLATAMVVYTVVVTAGTALWGRRFLREGEPFAAFFGLLAHIAPLHRDDDGCLRLRPPLAGLPHLRRRPGLAAVILVALGTTSYDGLTRTQFWQEIVAGQSRSDAMLSNALGMAWMVAMVSILYVGAMRVTARITGAEPEDLVMTFVHTMVPIALAYAVAHYFSFLVFETNRFIGQLSDPLGRGWDLFGTAGWVDNLRILSPGTIAYVQAGSIVAGHIAGVLLAHDRAVARSRGRMATRSQYPLLVAMVGYTVGGLALLLSG
ncbi:MAG: hypothetical protein M3357_16890 [Actinomycetota bacterium]|nr:hypothetical protein [Actinomycetota bacterium]